MLDVHQITQIAGMAGCDPRTVRKLLILKQKVRPMAEARILAAAKELRGKK